MTFVRDECNKQMIIRRDVGPYVLEGSANPAVVMGGHSHILAPLMGIHAGALVDIGMEAAVLHSDDRSLWPNITVDYWIALRDEEHSDIAVVCWNGNQHNALFMLDVAPRFTLAGVLANQGRNTVPRQMLRQLWQQDASSLAEAVKILKTKKKVLVIGTPPPNHARYIHNFLQADPFFNSRAGELGIDIASVEITPDEVRLELWHIIQSELQRVSAATGVSFVPAPPSAMDGDGFLLADLAAPDATHTNDKYGALVWRTVRENLKVMG